MSMDVIEAHAARLPSTGGRWIPGPHARADLIAALLEARIAGEVTHPLDNVHRHIEQLCEGDPDKQFGMTGLADAFSPWEVLELVASASGFTPDPDARSGPVTVDPELVLAACEEAGERLALACERGERIVLATGHPVGLIHLYTHVGRFLAERGAKLLRPFEDVAWREPASGRSLRIVYFEGVAILADEHRAHHTHSGDPMLRMLGAARPDLIFADHGFAGAALEAGIEALSIADVNDPALIVARALGRTRTVIVMDDAAGDPSPGSYWPCFQAIASRFPSA
jgi:hypothetical protein